MQSKQKEATEQERQEEEGCERGVPHSMCPWLFSAPALLRVEQVGGCGLEEEEVLSDSGVWLCLVQGQDSGFCSLSLSLRLLSTSSCPPAYLAGSLVGFNNSV